MQSGCYLYIKALRQRLFVGYSVDDLLDVEATESEQDQPKILLGVDEKYVTQGAHICGCPREMHHLVFLLSIQVMKSGVSYHT